MKCKQCGAEIKNDEKFCRICGARLPAAAAETVESATPEVKKPEPQKPAEDSAAKPEKKPKKEKKPFKLPKKVIIIAAIVAIAVIIAVAAIMLIRGGGNSELSLDPNRPFVVEYYDKAVVYASDGTALASVGGYAEVCESVWGDTIVIRGLETVVVSGGVATDLHVAAYDVTVSADGSHVAYITVPPETVPGVNDGDGGDLYVYEVESGERTFIDTDVIVDTVVLSPDGSRLAYNIFDLASDAEHTLVGKSTGEGERLLDCERMYALSNDGVYMYFENNDRFYVGKDGVRTRLNESEAFLYDLYTNSTGTEAIAASQMSSENGTVFETLYVKDGDIYYQQTGLSFHAPLGFDVSYTIEKTQIVRTESFANNPLMFTGAYFIDVSTGNSVECYIAVGSETGKKVAYIDTSGNICVSKGDITTAEIVTVTPDERPTELFADAKLSNIYFTNARGELWRLNGEKTEMVSADASSFCMSGSGTLYFLYDGVVLCRADGSERVSLGRMDDYLDIVESIFGDIEGFSLNLFESTPQGIIVKPVSGETIYFRDGSTEGITLSTTVTTPTEVE